MNENIFGIVLVFVRLLLGMWFTYTYVGRDEVPVDGYREAEAQKLDVLSS